jgi:heme o synthase
MYEKLKPYIALCKPRILFLVTLTSAVGFYLGERGIKSWYLFFFALLGTGLSCAGAGVLNNYLERDVDKLMKRTCRRPIPSGEVAPADALIFGVLLVLVGTALLVMKVNLLSGFLALLTAFLYVLVYTPLKRITWLNTFVGAIPGALPPMGGWAAATGEISLGAWVLFFILFLWQHPHFYAIAWMYKEDYSRGGFKMLPVVDPSGVSTFRQIIIYSILLMAFSALPTVIGMAGFYYLTLAVITGVFMLMVGVSLFKSQSVQDARRLLRASIVYLPVVLLLVIIDSL